MNTKFLLLWMAFYFFFFYMRYNLRCSNWQCIDIEKICVNDDICPLVENKQMLRGYCDEHQDNPYAYVFSVMTAINFYYLLVEFVK